MLAVLAGVLGGVLWQQSPQLPLELAFLVNSVGLVGVPPSALPRRQPSGFGRTARCSVAFGVNHRRPSVRSFRRHRRSAHRFHHRDQPADQPRRAGDRDDVPGWHVRGRSAARTHARFPGGPLRVAHGDVLFGIAVQNGTVAWIVDRLVSSVGGRRALVPWVVFIVAALPAMVAPLGSTRRGASRAARRQCGSVMHSRSTAE